MSAWGCAGSAAARIGHACKWAMADHAKPIVVAATADVVQHSIVTVMSSNASLWCPSSILSCSSATIICGVSSGRCHATALVVVADIVSRVAAAVPAVVVVVAAVVALVVAVAAAAVGGSRDSSSGGWQ